MLSTLSEVVPKLDKSPANLALQVRIYDLMETILIWVCEKSRYDLPDETFLLNFAAWKDDSLSKSCFIYLKPMLCVRNKLPTTKTS